MTFISDPGQARAVETEVRELLSALVARHGGMLGHFVLLAEVVEIAKDQDVQVDTGMWTATSRDSKTWNSIGLMQTGIMLEQAAMTADEVEDR